MDKIKNVQPSPNKLAFVVVYADFISSFIEIHPVYSSDSKEMIRER